jgi:hypothetical protein
MGEGLWQKFESTIHQILFGESETFDTELSEMTKIQI